MAGYREHISVSGLLGAAYGAGAALVLGFTPVQGALAACLTWVAGMLPDLDSESGRPVREVSSLVAAIVPMVLTHRLLTWGIDAERVMLIAVLTYAAIRYGGALVLARLSVHRGMFHSVPALLIAAELTFVGYKSDSLPVKLLMAGGVALGFFSHLLLDELYSVEWTGVRLKLNKSAGSAIKFVGRNIGANCVTYGLLITLTYAILTDMGVLTPQPAGALPTFHQAEEEAPAYR